METSPNTYPGPNTLIQFLLACRNSVPAQLYNCLFLLNPWLLFQCLVPQHSTLYTKTRLNLYRILPQKLSWNSGTLTWILKWDSWTSPKCPLTVKRQKLSLSYRIVTSGSIIPPNDFMSHLYPHLRHHLPHKFHWERTSSLCQAIFHQYKDVCNKQFGYLHSTGYYYSLHQCPPGPHNCCSGMLYH